MLHRTRQLFAHDYRFDPAQADLGAQPLLHPDATLHAEAPLGDVTRFWLIIAIA